ncbi:MAG: asparagine synthase-related protein [Lentisphaeria bacterium]
MNCKNLFGEIIRDLNLSDGVAISLSGGRDSRFTMAELVNVLGNQNIKAFTVGSKRDTEGWFASKICNKFKIAHKTLPPHRTSVSAMEHFIWAIEDFDPGICTHHELLQILQQSKLPVVDSNSTEILLGHVEKGYGRQRLSIEFFIQPFAT